MLDRAFILIYLQSEDRTNDNGDGKDETERLLPKKFPCLLVGFKGPRVGILAKCFYAYVSGSLIVNTREPHFRPLTPLLHWQT